MARITDRRTTRCRIRLRYGRTYTQLVTEIWIRVEGRCWVKNFRASNRLWRLWSLLRCRKTGCSSSRPKRIRIETSMPNMVWQCRTRAWFRAWRCHPLRSWIKIRCTATSEPPPTWNRRTRPRTIQPTLINRMAITQQFSRLMAPSTLAAYRWRSRLILLARSGAGRTRTWVLLSLIMITPSNLRTVS